MSVLIVVDHDQNVVAPSAAEALTAGCGLAERLGTDAVAVVAGSTDPAITALPGEYGVSRTIAVDIAGVADYAPQAWATAVIDTMRNVDASVVMTAGTERGNEVMAHVGALTGSPMIANCTHVEPGEPWTAIRVRWGGSLLEHTEINSDVVLYTTAPHSVEPVAAAVDGSIEQISISVDADAARVMVIDRVGATEGVTLATAPVIVSGGRGVGSEEGFGPLEELASLLGGVVGCSRVVTNNGWRSHRDQVGQTGTVVAPDVYIACGISGAIQHWVGMMNAKTIVAINTDPQAPMVTKSDYAIIADLQEVVPAIIEAVKKRRSSST